MSDYDDIDKLISDSLASGSVNNVFRERLLRESTVALVENRRLQRQLQVTGII